MSQPRQEDGTFGEVVSDEDFLDAIEDGGTLTRDLMEEFDLVRSGVTQRLNQLKDEGKVRKEWVADVVVWHRVEDESD